MALTKQRSQQQQPGQDQPEQQPGQEQPGQAQPGQDQPGQGDDKPEGQDNPSSSPKEDKAPDGKILDEDADWDQVPTEDTDDENTLRVSEDTYRKAKARGSERYIYMLVANKGHEFPKSQRDDAKKAREYRDKQQSEQQETPTGTSGQTGVTQH